MTNCRVADLKGHLCTRVYNLCTRVLHAPNLPQKMSEIETK